MLDSLKDKIILSDEIGKYIKISRKGELGWGRCPFHSEKTASFCINDSKKFFYCFGCGESGDIFAFYKKHLKKDFKETLEILCKLYGIKLLKIKSSNQDKYHEILQKALSFYQNNLLNNVAAQEYLQMRNINDQAINTFKLGYAEESTVVNYLIKDGYTIDNLIGCGLVSYGSFDRFRNRIIFPICDKKNNIIGFAGRSIDENMDPKYLNSSDTELFHKNLHLFNENNLIKDKPVVLVEGYMDVITMTTNGIENVVASMGTALSHGQVLSIFKNSQILYLMFDNDEAGHRALEKNIEICLKLLKIEQKLFICILNKYKDPDEIIQKIGIKGVYEVLNHSLEVWDWFWDKLTSGQKTNPTNIAKMSSEIDSFVFKIKDKHLKIAYQNFYKNKFYEYLKNYKKPINTRKIINSEAILMTILLKDSSAIEELIEEIMLIQFQDIKLEQMRQDLVDFLTLEGNSIDETVGKIKIKYKKKIEELNYPQNLSYIMNNRSFELLYLKDIINNITIRNNSNRDSRGNNE